MKIVIDTENISIVFEDNAEKKKFIDSKEFQKFLKMVDEFVGDKAKEKITGFDWEKTMKEHPEIWNPNTYPIPDHDQNQSIDTTPYINDPPRFPGTNVPNHHQWITVTQDTQQYGGCDATPKFNGCDATPRYGKATVDWPSKYPCDATPAFLKDNGKKKRSRK